MSAGNINPHWCFSFFKILPPKTSKFFVLSNIKYISSASLKQIKTAISKFLLIRSVNYPGIEYLFFKKKFFPSFFKQGTTFYSHYFFCG